MELPSIIQGDALHLPLIDESVDAVVCDPPYNLSFMGKGWDTRMAADALALAIDVLTFGEDDTA